MNFISLKQRILIWRREWKQTRKDSNQKLVITEENQQNLSKSKVNGCIELDVSKLQNYMIQLIFENLTGSFS